MVEVVARQGPGSESPTQVCLFLGVKMRESLTLALDLSMRLQLDRSGYLPWDLNSVGPDAGVTTTPTPEFQPGKVWNNETPGRSV